MTADVPVAGEARSSLSELARLFAKLGCIAFGGPAAHIAMLEDEVVTRRRWMSRQHFLDLVGATNLIPGPNSTEMTMHVGYDRAGWRGLIVAGACFIFPAVILTGILAWLYVQYGELPHIEPWLYGIKPAVLAIVLGALWKLGRKAVKDARHATLGLAVAGLVLAGVDEVAALFAGGLIGALWFHAGRRGPRDRAGPAGGGTAAGSCLPLAMLRGAPQAAGAAAVGAVAGVSLGKLFLFFLKVGAVLYGSGYVLVAFLEGGLVQERAWLTQAQLLDAIAIGQLTPGPVLSTATFVGYVIEGVAGAVVATVGIFLPSFVFVAILGPLIPKLRASTWMSALLDAVNVAAVALMLAALVDLGRGSLVSWQAAVIATAAGLAVLRFKLNAVWLVLGAAVLGRALMLL